MHAYVFIRNGIYLSDAKITLKIYAFISVKE